VKILHVLPTLSPRAGGPTQVALNLVRELNHQGLNAEIATTNDNGSDLLAVPLEKWIDYQDAPVRFFQRTLRLKEYLVSPSLAGWLWQHVNDYDVLDLHYLFSFAPSIAAAIARQHRVPYTVRTMGQLSSWALTQGKIKKNIYSHVIERKNLHFAKAVHCTSLDEAKDVEDFGIKTPKVILPLGVLPTQPILNASQSLHQSYAIPNERLIILFLSRLHYKKRPDWLIKTIASLSPHLPPHHLIVAGSGETDYQQYLEHCVAKAGLTSKVTFAGFVSGFKKDLLLQGADLFVLPSFSENFGIAVAEALGAGLPVIITKGVQLSPDVQAAHAGLVIDDNQDSLQSALESMLQSPSLRQSCGQNAQQLASTHYHWPTITHQLIQSYRDILKKASIRISD
jgi:glycosyltransferase involved in cell wall biosynthesis